MHSAHHKYKPMLRPSLSVLVVKTSTGENFFTLNRSDATGAPIYDVHKAVFSPKGTYLVTWYNSDLYKLFTTAYVYKSTHLHALIFTSIYL